MPGIVGIISQKPPEECQRVLQAMVASMEHEPFHVSGICSVPEMGIHAGWIAHENSFASGQVFWNEGRDVALVFSGECFFDSQTCVGLRQKGHQINENKSGWLVHLYEEEGDRFFEKLNGLFSGLLIDKRQGRAFLFNDRYAVERIYWHENAEGFYFASEAKALLRVLPELRSFDEEGVAEYLALGCTVESKTLFQGISLLFGASLFSFERGNCSKSRYFSQKSWENQTTLPASEFQAQFQETFKRILPRYFDSSADIGISLTAGLDTRMFMACLPPSAGKPVCFTFTGETGETLDASIGGKVARACGLEHHVLRINPDFFSDFAAHADRTVYVTDGCFGITGAHEIYMNRQARRLAPIRLTGNYGGEILRGVTTFKPQFLAPDLLTPEFRQKTDAVAGKVYPEERPTSFAAFREIPFNLFGNLQAGRSQVGFRTPYLDNELVALAYRAPDTSRLAGLRLVRDNHPALGKIYTDKGDLGEDSKLARSFRRAYFKVTFKLDYLNSHGLSGWLAPLNPVLRSLPGLGLHKHLHYCNWFKQQLAPYLTAELAEAGALASPIWNRKILRTMAADHIRGRSNYVNEINAVLTLGAVERLLFRNLSREISGETPFRTGVPELRGSVTRAHHVN